MDDLALEVAGFDGVEVDDAEGAYAGGGQIAGERMRLFMVYSAGNFIESTTDTPYLQIGEHKYGKPVLDRAISYGMELYDALKVGLVSIDSTMRSNLSVGMPIDLLVVRRDVCDAGLIHRIESLNAFVACDTRDHPHTAAFLLCDCCGSSEEIAIPAVPEIEAAAARTGFQVKHVTLEAHGLCRGCQ